MQPALVGISAVVIRFFHSDCSAFEILVDQLVSAVWFVLMRLKLLLETAMELCLQHHS